MSLALVPVTWWLPLFTARVPFLWRQEVSIATGLVELWRLDLLLFAAVLLFSVLAPLAKGVALAWVWYRARRPGARAGSTGWRCSASCRMTEVFLLAVIIVGLKGVGIGRWRSAGACRRSSVVVVLSLAASTWAWRRWRAARLAVPPGRLRPVARQEGLERRPDVLAALDQHRLEILGLEAAEPLEHRALVVVRAHRLDLAVAEQVADLAQLARRLERLLIVGLEIVAVGAVEGVDVPVLGW